MTNSVVLYIIYNGLKGQNFLTRKVNSMKFKIVADSSSDVLKLDGVDFASAPLKIITNERFLLRTSTQSDKIYHGFNVHTGGKIK